MPKYRDQISKKGASFSQLRLAERESGIMMMVPREFPPTGLSLAPRVNVNWATNEYPQYRPRSGRHVGHDHRYHHHLQEIGIIVFIIIDTTNILSIYITGLIDRKCFIIATTIL